MPVVITLLSGPHAGKRLTFEQPTIGFGRAADNDFIFDAGDRRASAHHAAIEQRNEEYYIQDLNSKNGTYIGPERVRRRLIGGGEIIEFGRKGPRVLFQILSDAQQTLALHPSSSPDTPQTPTLSASLDAGERSREGLRRIGSQTMQFLVNAATRQASAQLRRWFILVAVIVFVVASLAIYQAIIQSRRRSDRLDVPDSADLTEIVASNQRAVVLVQVKFVMVDERGQIVAEGSSEGSGFSADSDGHLITNYHIVKPWEFDPELSSSKASVRSRSIRVIFADHRASDAMEADLRDEDSRTDLAILKIPSSPELPTVQGFDPDMSHLRQGEEVVYVGFPLGWELLRSTNQERATTSLIRTTISKVTKNVLQVDAPVYHGFSGSPILNHAGQVVAVLTARLGEADEANRSGARSIGIATPIGYALDLLARQADRK